MWAYGLCLCLMFIKRAKYALKMLLCIVYFVQNFQQALLGGPAKSHTFISNIKAQALPYYMILQKCLLFYILIIV